jgi:hypothetical protein
MTQRGGNMPRLIIDRLADASPDTRHRVMAAMSFYGLQ